MHFLLAIKSVYTRKKSLKKSSLQFWQFHEKASKKMEGLQAKTPVSGLGYALLFADIVYMGHQYSGKAEGRSQKKRSGRQRRSFSLRSPFAFFTPSSPASLSSLFPFFLLCCLLAILCIPAMPPATRLEARQPPAFPEKQAQPEKPEEGRPLPDGYRNYTFGQSYQQVAKAIKRDTALHSYDAMPLEDFGFNNWTIITATGKPYFRNVYFLFSEKKLFCIVLLFNRTRYSYLEVLKSLKNKYGTPAELGQDKSIWQNDETRLQLESNVTLKYLDIKRFARLRKNFDPSLFDAKIDKYLFLKGL